jgi:hypothetical protein
MDIICFVSCIKRDALTLLKKPSSKTRRQDLAKKKCGKEGRQFHKGSSGKLIFLYWSEFQ